MHQNEFLNSIVQKVGLISFLWLSDFIVESGEGLSASEEKSVHGTLVKWQTVSFQRSQVCVYAGWSGECMRLCVLYIFVHACLCMRLRFAVAPRAD